MSECIVLDARKVIFDASKTISTRKRHAAHPRSQKGLGRPVVENGHRRSKVLGPFAGITKSEAESRLGVILKPLNEGAGHPQQPIYTFGVYLQEVFLSAVAPK